MRKKFESKQGIFRTRVNGMPIAEIKNKAKSSYILTVNHALLCVLKVNYAIDEKHGSGKKAKIMNLMNFTKLNSIFDLC
jgi:hypothetical protein